jgi:hypothetical protein
VRAIALAILLTAAAIQRGGRPIASMTEAEAFVQGLMLVLCLIFIVMGL